MILDRCTSRFEFEEQEQRQLENTAEEEKVEREQMATIDWHDFVAVETIEFTKEDEEIPLAVPIDTSTGAAQGAPTPLDRSEAGISRSANVDLTKRPGGIE